MSFGVVLIHTVFYFIKNCTNIFLVAVAFTKQHVPYNTSLMRRPLAPFCVFPVAVVFLLCYVSGFAYSIVSFFVQGHGDIVDLLLGVGCNQDAADKVGTRTWSWLELTPICSSDST